MSKLIVAVSIKNFNVGKLGLGCFCLDFSEIGYFTKFFYVPTFSISQKKKQKKFGTQKNSSTCVFYVPKNQDSYLVKDTSSEIMSQTFSIFFLKHRKSLGHRNFFQHSQIEKNHDKNNKVPTFFYVKSFQMDSFYFNIFLLLVQLGNTT